MKLTWFGGSCLRANIGGQVLVIDPDDASADVERNELLSGADHVLTLEVSHRQADGATWKPRSAQRLLDAGEAVRAAEIWSLGADALLIDADDDMPLVVLGGAVPVLGRWVERAVVVLAGPELAERAAALVGAAAPRLIGLAGNEADIEAALAMVRDKLDGTGLVALEPGMAVEV